MDARGGHRHPGGTAVSRPPGREPVGCRAAKILLGERGGTGRRAGFRSRWGNPWGFESPRSHSRADQGVCDPADLARQQARGRMLAVCSRSASAAGSPAPGSGDRPDRPPARPARPGRPPARPACPAPGPPAGPPPPRGRPAGIATRPGPGPPAASSAAAPPSGAGHELGGAQRRPWQPASATTGSAASVDATSPGSGAGTDRPVGLGIAMPVAVDATEKEGAVPGAGRESAA
jgi:hypothetical protein